MGQATGFRSDRLFNAIEALGLDQRAYHLLKRAKIHHISNIIIRGEKQILNLKNIGTITANHIFSAVAKYLEIPREELFSKKVVDAAMSCEERPFDPLEAPISVLDLPASTINSLNSLGLFVISDLLKADEQTVYEVVGLNKNEVGRIFSVVNLYLSRINRVNAERTSNQPTTLPTTINLSVLLTALLRNERTSRIVELRANRLLTLEAIATEVGGVTRERIRQIIDQVLEKVRQNLNLLIVLGDHLQERSKDFGEKPENITINALVDYFKLKSPGFDLLATNKELEMLIAIMRLMVLHEKPWALDILNRRWIIFVDLICFANPPITSREAVYTFLKEEKEINRRLKYKELVLLILSKEKKPMHWLEIADRAYRLSRRDSFNSTALYNSLMSHPDLFVRVDAGTYALVEWGLNQVNTYPDIIASIMKSHKKALPAETIYHKVKEIRPVKQTTLTMLLELHPRFYKSLEKTYGLRAWLLPREKQTLRTPEWLVEDGDSLKRLEHASQRGYDVDSMVKVDLDAA